MVRRRECRSHCPISFALDIFGDPWSLLVIRDALFFGKSTFREFQQSGEGIASNILAERLERLVRADLLKKAKNPKRAGGSAYVLTEKGLDLLPTLLEIITWSAQHDPKTATPPEFVRRLKKDRARLMKEIWARARSTASPSPPGKS